MILLLSVVHLLLWRIILNMKHILVCIGVQNNTLETTSASAKLTQWKRVYQYAVGYGLYMRMANLILRKGAELGKQRNIARSILLEKP